MAVSIIPEAMAAGATVQTILQNKGSEVWSVGPDDTVLDAIALMAEKSVGALMVLGGPDQILGMVSERDYARKVILQGRSSKDTLIRDIMTTPVIVVSSTYTVAQCLLLMTEHRIRHLPVVDSGRITGVLSIGDLVRATVAAQQETIAQLTRYIMGHYPA
jgi:CBS domain-containing protein